MLITFGEVAQGYASGLMVGNSGILFHANVSSCHVLGRHACARFNTVDAPEVGGASNPG